MSTPNFGNQLNAIVFLSRAAMFDQGELAELTYGAFDIAARNARTLTEPITLSFPVGYKADRTTIQGSRTYTRDQLVERYQFLAVRQLCVNAIVQLVTIVHAMLADSLRAIVMKYPQKLGAKRSITVQTVLESQSIEEVHLRAVDTLINELSYKTPIEFAEEFASLTGVNLLECPAYHTYMEVKASRDVFVHNRGIANAIYVRKAGTHARVGVNETLPADAHYLLESYERCLQVADWLELQLHDKWYSSDFEERKQPQLPLTLAPGPPPAPAAPAQPPKPGA